MRSRYLVRSVFVAIALLSGVVYSACNKNKCGSTACQNGGACVSDKCSCPTGYTGNNCAGSWTDPIIGTYRCSRSECSPASGGNGSWTSAITRSATNGGYTVSIADFDNGITVEATVDSLHKISIKPASGATSGVSASGAYANDTISLRFTTSSSGAAGGYTCKMLMVKM